ncbi:OmpH family outer membrane protein [Flavilitoribacter nigricans]|uniref:Uncharacterized protein n=1 Tax=Flavilitoribacter nigricans (strain ATCC 23147 / DSM 23189 / NBRC 102662 / NCIMB 1420 / SS-2) TaxID=1122177 RepID=A0A2D0NGI3_FLAN2|nr:OmpH family outer membrane protein [Flavilitoribacter nigricans]PHN07496.1 hypothetical protein CRP01_05185 [Flavilitoribacter nigricans DSM 23189 = NBRC 102662]
MGKNYNIKINPQQPSKESISQRMDFDALLSKYESESDTGSTRKKTAVRPLRVRYLSYIGAAAAAIALLIMAISVFNRPKPATLEARYFANRPFVDQPLEKAQARFASFRVDVNQGGVYEYESGSRLVVPAAAFMDDYGKLVEGEVEIKYREYHDFVDFFLSGIPMVYDSANVKYTMESAGMIEIYAEQNGKRVRMAPGKNISVEMISRINVAPHLAVPPGYNVYKLDTAARKWVYQGIDQMEVLEEFTQLDPQDPLYKPKKTLKDQLEQIESSYQQQKEQLENSIPAPTAPSRPISPDADLPTFELAPADNVPMTEGADQIWYVSSQNTNFDPRSLNVEWEDYRFERINDHEYRVIFTRGDNELRILVHPALTGDAFAKAMKQYETAFAAYEQQMQEREKALSDRADELEDELFSQRKVARETYQESIEELIAADPDLKHSADFIHKKVRNRFVADGFGIWNCDRLVPPLMQEITANFIDQNGASIENRTAYLVDKTRNTVHRFLAQDGARIRYNSYSENLLWIVTEDNRLAVCDPAIFRAIDPDQEEVTFILNEQSVPPIDEAAVRSVLKFN